MLSLFRKLQYQKLAKVELNGKVLDLGGSRKSGYHELFQGSPEFVVANISKHYGFDVYVDLEKKFPFENESFDNAIAINLIEHIYDYKNVFSETQRVLKSGGLLVFTIPFLFHKHGCPDDYNRFTDEALKKIAQEHNFDVIVIEELGEGIFSVFYQMLPIPNLIRPFFELLFVSMDKSLLAVSKGYRKLKKEYPLGYFAIYKKRCD